MYVERTQPHEAFWLEKGMLRTLSKALWRESCRYFFQCQFGWRSLSQFRRFWFDFSWSSFHTFICYWERLFLYKFDSQLSFHPPFIKLQVSLPGPHMDEELESSTSFRKNFPGMTFPKNRISISLKPSPRKLDCPAFPNSHYLEQPHLPSHTRRADF